MKITVEKKRLPGGRQALYLSFYNQRKRWRKSLRLVLEEPVTAEIRRLNKEKLQVAQAIRSKYELEWAIRCHGLPFVCTDDGTDWWAVFRRFVHDYSGKDVNTVKAMYIHLQHYASGTPLFTSALTRAFCQGFYDYLRARLHGNTPGSYFKKFKQCLDRGVEDQLLPVNPAAHVRCIQYNEFTKDILGTDEMNRLAAAPCKHEEVKRAFLFACHTGLRWCDIVELRGASIDYAHRMIHIVQQKVRLHSSKAVLHLALSHTAMKILEKRSYTEQEHVFVLPSYSYANRVLKQWAKAAGLTKHVTFHCARHSFITNLLIYGANIKTASELAGHSTIRHTEKYIHVVDELKRQAVDNLPSIDWE